MGAEFEAFGEDGVRGRNLALVPGRMIVQSCRARPWREDDLDSVLILTFSKTAEGARVELVQVNVPDHAFEIIDEGWETQYWKPWREYLNARRAA